VSDTLPGQVRDYLLTLARESIRSKLDGGQYPRNPPEDAVLHAATGAFVTLKNLGALRGCIGRMESDSPLWETVARMARAAAFEDPRFPPVTEDEIDDLSLEISVLTPFEPLEDPARLEVGTHGLLVEKGVYRGVLLPQVATEHGWGAEEFLANVCLKASLPTDAWKDPDTRLYVFSAIIIEER
jgi:AmmeMemoRadiSam system protein A